MRNITTNNVVINFIPLMKPIRFILLYLDQDNNSQLKKLYQPISHMDLKYCDGIEWEYP